MQSQGSRQPIRVTELVERLLATRKMTRADQHQLMATLLSKNTLSPEEQAQVNRVYEGLRRGWIRVVD